MKQVLSVLLARIGASATRPLAARLDDMTARLAHVAARLDEMAPRLDSLDSLDSLAERLDGVETSLGVLHRAVEDLAAIPALSSELVDGIAEAEARAAGRLTEVERLLAGR